MFIRTKLILLFLFIIFLLCNDLPLQVSCNSASTIAFPQTNTNKNMNMCSRDKTFYGVSPIKYYKFDFKAKQSNKCNEIKNVKDFNHASDDVDVKEHNKKLKKKSIISIKKKEKQIDNTDNTDYSNKDRKKFIEELDIIIAKNAKREARIEEKRQKEVRYQSPDQEYMAILNEFREVKNRNDDKYDIDSRNEEDFEDESTEYNYEDYDTENYEVENSNYNKDNEEDIDENEQDSETEVGEVNNDNDNVSDDDHIENVESNKLYSVKHTIGINIKNPSEHLRFIENSTTQSLLENESNDTIDNNLANQSQEDDELAEEESNSDDNYNDDDEDNDKADDNDSVEKVQINQEEQENQESIEQEDHGTINLSSNIYSIKDELDESKLIGENSNKYNLKI